jgi:hypothetical protein
MAQQIANSNSQTKSGGAQAMPTQGVGPRVPQYPPKRVTSTNRSQIQKEIVTLRRCGWGSGGNLRNVGGSDARNPGIGGLDEREVSCGVDVRCGGELDA